MKRMRVTRQLACARIRGQAHMTSHLVLYICGYAIYAYAHIVHTILYIREILSLFSQIAPS